LKAGANPLLRSFEGTPSSLIAPQDKDLYRLIKEFEDKATLDLVVLEIQKTESDYCEDLRILIHVFMEPLMKAKLISETKVQTLFSNIEEIYEVIVAFIMGIFQFNVKFKIEICKINQPTQVAAVFGSMVIL
jgi:hypothetical protein